MEAPGEAAFYGPKSMWKLGLRLGEFTLATNQLDFAVPKRFNLTVDKDGKEKTPLAIHRAPLSNSRTFNWILIEHFAGLFQLGWLLCKWQFFRFSDKFLDFAGEVRDALAAHGVKNFVR